MSMAMGTGIQTFNTMVKQDGVTVVLQFDGYIITNEWVPRP